MTNRQIAFWKTVLRGLVLALALSVVAEGTASAEGSFIVGKWAYQRLNKAHKAIGEKKYSAALKILGEMKERSRLNDHERAMMWQTYGFVYSSKGQFPKAITAFNKCIALKAMPEAAMNNMEFNLGQLYMATKKYKDAVRLFESWMKKAQSPSPHSYYMIAMAYSQVKKYNHALHYAKKAIAQSSKPQESWYQFILSLYFKFKKYQKVAEMLELLVREFPRKSYWVQLASVYSQLKKDKEALAVMELSYLQDFLERESELMNLASLYMHNGVPYKAARVMEEGIDSGSIKKTPKSYKMLAESLLHARESKNAVKPLQEAAKMEKKGDLYVQLAQVYLEQEEWTKAVGALNKAIKKGNLTNPGTTYLLLGITKNNMNQFGGAIQAFNQAKKYKQTEKSASQWIGIVRARSRG